MSISPPFTYMAGMEVGFTSRVTASLYQITRISPSQKLRLLIIQEQPALGFSD
jgi:hypothetical protein